MPRVPVSVYGQVSVQNEGYTKYTKYTLSVFMKILMICYDSNSDRGVACCQQILYGSSNMNSEFHGGRSATASQTIRQSDCFTIKV